MHSSTDDSEKLHGFVTSYHEALTSNNAYIHGYMLHVLVCVRASNDWYSPLENNQVIT